MKRTFLALASVIAVAISGVVTSGANFVALQQNPGNNIAAKADFMPPTISMTDPGPSIGGTVPLATTASDSASGVQSVTIERAPAGTGTWSTACTASSSPWGCSFNTASGGTPDGLYDFRAIATDNAGYSATSATVANRMIDNTAPTGVTMTDPGTPISGIKAFSGTGVDTGGSGVASLKFQYRPTSGGAWLDACTDTSSPYGCSLDTATIADNVYDFRALATDNAGNTTASTVYTSRRVDNFAPTVTMNDPGAYLKGTVPLTATAADGGGILNVVIQRRPNGGSTWTTVCTATVSVYTCSLNTGSLADGAYDFQAIATDNAARVTTSATMLNRYVDNTVPGTASMTNPGTPLTGTVTLAGTAADAESGIASATIQVSTAGANAWVTACVDTTSPYSCSYDTTQLADGPYDFRLVATDRAGNVKNSAKQGNKDIDNNPPTVTMGDPGALGGTETLTATASDAGAGVTSVKIQYTATGGSSWTDVCTDGSSPYSCSFDTTPLPDGNQYDFRAIATDGAAFTTTSAVVGPRTVDHTAPTISFTAPAGPLSGSVALASTPADGGSGIASVIYQYKLSSGSTWSTACTGASSPWGCNWASTGVADDAYDLRAIATDAVGNQTTSAASTNRVVDNDTTPTPANIQTTRVGGTSGIAEVNDFITFTFSEPIQPSSILSGWNGTSTSVVVRIDDFATTPFDRLTVYDSTDATLTGLTAANGVRLGGDYVPASGVKFNATMVMTGSAVTVTFTSVRSGGVNGTAASNGTMQWSPSASALDLAGHAVNTATFNETGGGDKEF